jgi:hypothetical protein
VAWKPKKEARVGTVLGRGEEREGGMANSRFCLSRLGRPGAACAWAWPWPGESVQQAVAASALVPVPAVFESLLLDRGIRFRPALVSSILSIYGEQIQVV